MRIAKFLTTTMMVVIFLSACNRNAVLLDYTNAKDEVPQLGNLVFRFSQPLVHDSLMNQWDSTEYVSFEPKIPGRFRWESSSELVFSPLRPLSPATTYKASINDEVLRSTKFDKVEKGAGLSFKTPDLKLENSNITWVIDDQGSRQALPQLDLYFNYPVDPASLKSKLQVTIDGAAADYSVRTMSADNKMSLRLLNFKLADKDYQVDVVLGKGVVPEGGSNSTTETLSLKSFIPSPFTLTVNDVSAEHDGTTGTVTVKTSQQIVGEQLSNFVKISPAVKFTTETTEDGLLIRSEGFDVTKSYQLIFEKGLRGKIGGTLKEQYQGNVAFGKLEPSISFTNSRAIFLSGQGARNIEVKLISVPKVKVIVSKIYESNILSAQRHGYYPKEKGRSEEEYYYNDNNVGVDGDVIYEQEIETSTLARSGAGRLFNFNIADKLNDFKGIYHIKIRSTDDYWVSDSRFISVSDLGLIAREGTDKIFVFVNSIKTGQGVAGVNLNAYGANNQLIGTGTSNAEGVAEIKYAKNGFAGFNPAMIIARSETDFNFLPFNSTGVSTSRFDVGGKRVNQTGLDAFIYAERDIYRPGETVNFSVVVRDAAWKSPGEIPVKLRFLMPNGKELKTFRKNLNEQGSADGSVSIAASAITGSYSLELYNGNDVLLGNKNFMIEEFVPDRIKVTAKLDKAALSPGETATLNVNAVNFFGPPAANRNYETEIQVRQKSFVAKKYDRFDFSISNPGITFDKIVNEGKTDESGNITEKFVVKDEYKNVGMLQAVFYATVFDETGRPVSRNAQADIFTQQVFFGIGNDGWGYYPLNQSIKFPLAALNKGGQPTTATAKMEVIKHEYRTVLTKSGDYFRYESQREDKLVATSSVSITGDQGSYSFVPRSPGNYELRVSIPGSASFVKKEFYSYGGWSDNSSFEVNNEGNIDIELDRASYNSGETAKILFKTPFDGKMLVTFETDKVVSYQYVNVAKRSASVDIKLGVEHLPNVYVTATLIKPHEVSDIPLTVAHGYKSVRVEEKNRKMNVEIVASAAVRSKTHQKVSVKAAAGSYITLAAVDNGVLQVSDFKTPSPYDYFYAERALAVSAYDIYPLLFPEIRARLSSTGGDGELEMDKRVNPMPNKRIKIVSYWSGTKKADGSGNAAFEFDVPQFSGEIRLMAVAYKDESFGSAEANMKVADPLVLSTALPRFLSPGDTVSVPVTISNTTSKAASAVANISVQSPVQVIGEKSVTLQINANSEAVASFRVFAAPSVGAGKVSIQVQAAGEKFTEETDITVRPPSTLQKQTGSGTITNAGSTKVNIGTSDFMPGSDYHLVVSRSPVLELGNQFSYLIEYPYGCTEQTVSAAFPQLYYGDLADMFNSGKASKLSANDNIMEAIRKIKLRQLFNGAITLWDGEGTENWWVSAYAAHFLLEARKAGYNVDKGLIETLLSYLNNRLRNRETINYYYNQTQQKKIAPKEVAYSLYVLALAGRPNISVMNYYKSNTALLALDSRYLLSVSFAISGDGSKFRELLPASFAGEESVAQTGGSFYSDIRDEAVAMNALIDADPGNAQIVVMTRHLVQKLKARRWYNTQESAFSFVAIGKLARISNKSNMTASITANGKSVAMNGSSIRLTAKQLGSTNVDINTKGEGALYYWWESKGISTSGAYKEEDNFLKARRRFFDRYGRAISGNSFSQNDLVIVQLTLEKSYSGTLENIVLTDLLPAGFEIENPRTKELPGMEWIKDGATPVALDVRDDRINFFVDMYSNKQVFYYAVRAVSPGIFRMGPVSADAMYNGEYHSYHGALTIKIQ